MTTTHANAFSTRQPDRRRSAVGSFTRHYLEMLLAMGVGMVTFYPLWRVVTGSLAESTWVHRVDVDSMVMATAMTIPMVAWMWHRDHPARPTVEMSLAMYAGFAVLFPFLWAGLLDRTGVMMAGHVLMLVFMLGAMLARRHEYTDAAEH